MNQSASLRNSPKKDRIVRRAQEVYALLRSPTRPREPPPFQFGEGEVSIYVSYLLENSHFHTDLSALNDAISTALVPSVWPSPGLPALKAVATEASKNGVCGRVWREEELAYKCKTCERDPSCVICVPCFRNGNHNGHDYAMLRINGGCCDCGDDQAWQPNGFCCNHKGAGSENEDLSASMPMDLKRALFEAVTIVAGSVYKSCALLHDICRTRSQARPTLNMLLESVHEESLSLTKSVLKWLNELVSCGDGFRRAVGLLLTSTQLQWSTTEAVCAAEQDQCNFVSWLDLMLAMDGTGMLPDEIMSVLHSLYFKLITDVVFRRIFLERFARNYPRFIHAKLVRRYIDEEDRGQNGTEYGGHENDIVGSFTVQLFTVPALVPVMLQEQGLLEMLLKLLCILFESTSVPIGLYRDDVPFHQTNYIQQGLTAYSRRCASVEGINETRPYLDPLALAASQANMSLPNQSEGAEGRVADIQSLYQRTRERLRLMFDIETVAPMVREESHAPRSVSDTSEYDETDYEHDAAHASHQMGAFETGVRTLCPSIHCVVPNPPGNKPSSLSIGFIEAITRARNKEKAALRGEVPLAHTMRLDWHLENSLAVSDVAARIMADLNYVLSHPEVAFYIVHERVDLLRLFVRVFSLFQGMHPLSRRMGDHIPTEPSLWFEGFRIEMETYHLAELLVGGFCGNGSNVKKEASPEEKVSVDLKWSRLRAIGVLRKCLDEWLEREEHREALSTYAGEYFTVAHAISVHLPLHRIFALFVHHAMRIDELDLSTALSGDVDVGKCGKVARLLVHPLRIQSFLAQERAKMWRRNGRIASFMSAYYRYPAYSDWYADLDIFLQQCCAVQMNTDEFISFAMKTFRIKDIPNLMNFISPLERNNQASQGNSDRDGVDTGETDFVDGSLEKQDKKAAVVDTGILPLVPITFIEKTPNGGVYVRAPSDPKEDMANFAPILLEGLMTFFVHITSERSLCGLSEGQNLRRKLLHLLCSQDKTHSQLCRACSFRFSHNEDSSRTSQRLIDNVISTIANYVEPKKMEQGRYRLKDTSWKEFDPFFPQYAVRERNAAEVRHAAAMKRGKTQMMIIADEVIADRPLWKQFESLKILSLSLYEQHKLSLGTVILREALRHRQRQRMQTVTCSAALQLLCANIEAARSTHPISKVEAWLSRCCQPETFQESPLGILFNLAHLSTESQSSHYLDFMPVFSRIIRATYEITFSHDRVFLNSQLPESLRFLYSENARSPSEKEKLNSNEERRQKLIAKKKECQAAAMRRMRAAQETFAKLISETDESQPSAVVKPEVDKDMTQDGGVIAGNFSRGMSTGHTTVCEADTPGAMAIHKCALCHEAGVSDESGPLGYIGFRQNTKLPFISKDQSKFDSRPEHSRNTSVQNSSGDCALEMEVETNIDVESTTDFVSMNQKLIHLNLLREGTELSKCLHISLCSHVIHMECFERYFSSLLHSNSRRILFEGFNVVNLQRVEFLCPVCRRLANLVLPCVRFPQDGRASNETALRNSIHTSKAGNDKFFKWVENSKLRIFENKESMYQVHLFGSMGKLEWDFHLGVSQASFPLRTRATEATDPHSAGLILRMLQRFQVSIETYDSFITDAHGQKCRIWTSSYGLPVAIISTIASAEILVRSYEWDSSPLQTTRRTLPKLFACARAQFYMSPKRQGEECRKALQGLWNLIVSEMNVVADPFVALSYLFLMWPIPLKTEDIRFLTRLAFDCLVRQGSVATSPRSLLTSNFLVFLRRVSILRWCVTPWTKLPISQYDQRASSLESTDQEVADIAQYLELSNIPTLWKEVYVRSTSSPAEEEFLSKHCAPKPARLKILPPLFQTLLERLHGSFCSKCSHVAKNAALCLVCGKVLCGPSEGDVMEIAMHADVCGAGIGVFLLLKETKVYILRGDRSVEWGSPYLDAYGEEDASLRRGIPLLLNSDRYSALEQLWLSHGFDQDPRILVKTQRTSSPRELSPTLGPLGPVALFAPIRTVP
eukprot:gb/GEZJ01002532.1/.p1 GENE.gb/GEZJ01002532.1/~~gb/GEZJ01002532.1/.p1  ORF type:complete len:1990 (-),score=202.64 gb/GEZJ01002532.1/:1768-7737(-)